MKSSKGISLCIILTISLPFLFIFRNYSSKYSLSSKLNFNSRPNSFCSGQTPPVPRLTLTSTYNCIETEEKHNFERHNFMNFIETKRLLEYIHIGSEIQILMLIDTSCFVSFLNTSFEDTQDLPESLKSSIYILDIAIEHQIKYVLKPYLDSEITSLSTLSSGQPVVFKPFPFFYFAPWAKESSLELITEICLLENLTDTPEAVGFNLLETDRLKSLRAVKKESLQENQESFSKFASNEVDKASGEYGKYKKWYTNTGYTMDNLLNFHELKSVRMTDIDTLNVFSRIFIPKLTEKQNDEINYTNLYSGKVCFNQIFPTLSAVPKSSSFDLKTLSLQKLDYIVSATLNSLTRLGECSSERHFNVFTRKIVSMLDVTYYKPKERVETGLNASYQFFYRTHKLTHRTLKTMRHMDSSLSNIGVNFFVFFTHQAPTESEDREEADRLKLENATKFLKKHVSSFITLEQSKLIDILPFEALKLYTIAAKVRGGLMYTRTIDGNVYFDRSLKDYRIFWLWCQLTSAPILAQFYLEHLKNPEEKKFLWLMDYDVTFTGPSDHLIKKTDHLDADLLAVSQEYFEYRMDVILRRESGDSFSGWMWWLLSDIWGLSRLKQNLYTTLTSIIPNTLSQKLSNLVSFETFLNPADLNYMNSSKPEGNMPFIPHQFKEKPNLKSRTYFTKLKSRNSYASVLRLSPRMVKLALDAILTPTNWGIDETFYRTLCEQDPNCSYVPVQTILLDDEYLKKQGLNMSNYPGKHYGKKSMAAAKHTFEVRKRDDPKFPYFQRLLAQNQTRSQLWHAVKSQDIFPQEYWFQAS
eukprot:snap_masked-scaffold_1-processed-gene-10.24-mRNA-1 protein AED:1.00 eAED:1.00 QI:0/-1/0/0/-1/1/1/0/810